MSTERGRPATGGGPPRPFQFLGVALILTIALSASRWANWLSYARSKLHPDFACSSDTWSQPRVVSQLPPGTFLRTPTLAVTSQSLYLSGLPSPSAGVEKARVVSAAHLLASANADRLSVPPGSFAFLNARLLSDGAGRLHLVWGESRERRDSSFGHEAPAIRARSLWHAVFTPGIGWTPPRAIFTQPGDRDRLLWNSENADASFALSGRLHLVVPQINARLLHLTLENGTWRSESLPSPALYASVAETPDAALHVVYVGADPNRRGSINRLLIMHADANARRWSQPTPIPGRGPRTTTRPRLLAGRDRELHVAWGQIAPTKFVTEAVRHVSSDDGGRTWSAVSTLGLPGASFTKWRVGLDHCGAPQVVVSTWERRDSLLESHLLHSSLTPEGWTSFSDAFPGLNAREVDVMSDRTGALHLIASLRRSGIQSSPPSYDVMVSTLVSRSGPGR
jgi:hypothetical protein